MRQRSCAQIVEFGSGASSVRLAQALPEASILAIDHDREYLAATRAMLAERSEIENLTLEHRPLRWQRHTGALFYSYRPGPFPPSVDAVIIDGPPRIYPNGREACLYQIWQALAPGAIVYLDDAERPGELRALSNWSWRYGDEMGESVGMFRGTHHVGDLRQARRDARSRQMEREVERGERVARSATRA